MFRTDLLDIYHAAESSVAYMEKNAPNVIACKYTYLSWCNDVHFTIYLKPGIVIPIQIPAHEVNQMRVRAEFEQKLIDKLLGEKDRCQEYQWFPEP